ncbi:MAG: 23S rRNA (pseudouridine(1915)-N(3))-methyltransferase RlmH [Clostridiales bacterium]|jgi:23S rRNA (pseudouridine1915-N3)-methyltransferase|nr:23S rRNA (pseudouridine(1915)-N(3))-methyltransferase RlmH [Clostridiales bacterium]
MKPNICIIAVGGLKEAPLEKAAEMYLARLKPYGAISVIELPDEPAAENLSGAERLAVLAREGGRVLNRTRPLDIIASMAVEGRLGDLPFFCDLINKTAFEQRRLDFIIGGSLGLADSVLQRSKYKISLSGLTFTHRLTRLLLFEILCRALIKNQNSHYQI